MLPTEILTFMDANKAPALPVSVDTSSHPPPLARRDPVETIVHHDRRIDDYAWLREKTNPEVIAYLEAENAYAERVLLPTQVFQETLYAEMLGRILQTDLSVPYGRRGYLYFTRTEEGKQYPSFLRRLQAEGSPDEQLLDLNALAAGHSFMGLESFEISDDNQLLAYSTDTTGFRQYTLEIKDLSTGASLPERIPRVTSVAWAADNQTVFYTVEDEVTKRSHHLYRHTLGSSECDELLFDEPDERFRLHVERTRSGSFLLLTVLSHTASEVHILPADQPMAKFRLLAAREENHEYYVDHHPGGAENRTGGFLYVRTNSLGRTFGLMIVPVAEARREFWREVIPNRPEVMLGSVDVFNDHLVLLERENGLPYLRIVDLPAGPPHVLGASHRIEFTEPAYNASLGANYEFASKSVRFEYQSFITPRSIYDYDVRTGERVLLKQQPILGHYDSAQYSTTRLEATASDGTRIPLSVVRRRDTPLDGSAPLLLYGYGSYGISIPVNFNSNRLSLLDRGLVYVLAHIRGGGELGKPWHDAGRMQKKPTTFTDFISAAEYLIARKYTSSPKLIIEGGSAGGLLMGAVTNLRPDLFHAVITHVPFVDVLNTMLDASLPLTVGEYEEWGNPENEADYSLMKSYCPYTNVEPKAYPAILVKTGLNDSQVMYWEPAKYVAKLRSMKIDSRPLLFKVNMGAGHGGASGRYDYLREIALDYAFLLTQLGITK